jgi:hypothetical protein
MLGDGADLAPLKRLIIEKTEGNPFFMEETVEVLLGDYPVGGFRARFREAPQSADSKAHIISSRVNKPIEENEFGLGFVHDRQHRRTRTLIHGRLDFHWAANQQRDPLSL